MKISRSLPHIKLPKLRCPVCDKFLTKNFIGEENTKGGRWCDWFCNAGNHLFSAMSFHDSKNHTRLNFVRISKFGDDCDMIYFPGCQTIKLDQLDRFGDYRHHPVSSLKQLVDYYDSIAKEYHACKMFI
jgi:hypothetical protein